MTNSTLTPLWTPSDGQLRIAGFMSGSGSNLRKIIKHEHELKRERGVSSYHLAVIFSNRYNSNATLIGNDYDIPVLTRDDRGLRKARGKTLDEIREELDFETVKGLKPYDCRIAALGGYMVFASNILLNYFLACVNVHSAPLDVLDEEGERKYIGDQAVKLQLQAGEPSLRSTTHLLDDKPDHGPIFMISNGLPVSYPISDNIMDRMAKYYQSLLKEKGDWVIFPKTLEYIADGRFAKDPTGSLYFDGIPIPRGITPGGEVR